MHKVKERRIWHALFAVVAGVFARPSERQERKRQMNNLMGNSGPILN